MYKDLRIRSAETIAGFSREGNAIGGLSVGEPPEMMYGMTEAVGVFSAMFLVGQAAGAFAFGWVAHALGYASMWTILACSLLIGAALSMGLARPAPAAA